MSDPKTPLSKEAKRVVMVGAGLGGGLGAIVGMAVATILGFDLASGAGRIVGAVGAGIGAGLGVVIGQRQSGRS